MQKLSLDGQSLLTLAFIMWQNGKHAKALAILEGLQHLEPQNESYLPLLCAVYLDNQLYDSALMLGQRLMQKSTGYAHLCAAQICATSLWKTNQQAKATQLLQKALETMNVSKKS